MPQYSINVAVENQDLVNLILQQRHRAELRDPTSATAQIAAIEAAEAAKAADEAQQQAALAAREQARAREMAAAIAHECRCRQEQDMCRLAERATEACCSHVRRSSPQRQRAQLQQVSYGCCSPIGRPHVGW